MQFGAERRKTAHGAVLRRLPVLVAAGLGGLDLAAGERGGFKDPFITQSGLLIGFAGGYPVSLFVRAHLLVLSGNPGLSYTVLHSSGRAHLVLS